MVEINVCLCGAGAVYYDEHRFDCPYPYYGGDKSEMDAWDAARLAKIKARAMARGGELPEILKSAAVLRALLGNKE